MTARYNPYFNGKESLKEGFINVDKSFLDNYNKILPLFKFPGEELSKTVYPQMDRAIKKAAITIQRHSMYIKNVEYNRWIDDCYLLMAKSNFMKREFYTANEMLRYIIQTYKSPQEKYEAMFWLANSYLQMKKYTEAQGVLNLLNDNKSIQEMPGYLQKYVLITQAELKISNKEYDQAISAINLALKKNKKEKFYSKHLLKEHHLIKYRFNKKMKTRFHFVLGQLYELSEKPDSASMEFEKVIKMNPPYEMAFYSKIKRAKLFDVKSGKGDEIKKQLNKMAKDGKNKEFLDQIYYAMAEIALKENNIPEAIKYLRLSAQNSTTNNYQKSISYLKLADLYFERNEYVDAQMFYDSTMTFLPKDFENYESLKEKTKVLTELVFNLSTVQMEDSLQVLAKKSPAERDAVVTKIIQKLIAEEEAQKKLALQQQQMALNNVGSNVTQLGTQGGSSWYFDNPSTVSFGKQDFAKKWGMRKLEDNWRRSNKEVIADFGEVTADASAVDSASVSANPHDKNTYLKNIPVTKEQLVESHNRIRESLYNLGLIYRDNLKDYKRSSESFEDLNKRYPQNEHLLASWYRLYKNGIDMKNPAQTELYKNLILSKYPESDYAYIIKNPGGARISTQDQDKATILYQSTYDAWKSNNFSQVIKNKTLADTLYKGSILLPKFDYLYALAIGKTQDTASFRKALKEVVLKYPDSEVSAEAKSILNYLSKSEAPKSTSNKDLNKVSDNQMYNMNPNPNTIHFYCMVVSIMDADINKLKNLISDFNSVNYSLDNLQVNAVYLDDTHQLITITNFKGKDKAIDYYKNISTQKPFAPAMKKGTYSDFAISTENYTILYKQKNTAEYLKFFKENYLK